MKEKEALLLLSQAMNLIFDVEKELEVGSNVRQEGYLTRIQINKFKEKIQLHFHLKTS